jgi:hypothetical protein
MVYISYPTWANVYHVYDNYEPEDVWKLKSTGENYGGIWRNRILYTNVVPTGTYKVFRRSTSMEKKYPSHTYVFVFDKNHAEYPGMIINDRGQQLSVDQFKKYMETHPMEISDDQYQGYGRIHKLP